ncbi:MAG: hypothetical protein AAF416_15550 [Pseudomonadota bacterium]
MRPAFGSVIEVSEDETASHRPVVYYGGAYHFVGATTTHKKAWKVGFLTAGIGGMSTEIMMSEALSLLVFAHQLRAEGDHVNASRIKFNGEQMCRCVAAEMVAAHRACDEGKTA